MYDVKVYEHIVVIATKTSTKNMYVLFICEGLYKSHHLLY